MIEFLTTGIIKLVYEGLPNTDGLSNECEVFAEVALHLENLLQWVSPCFIQA